MEIFIEKLDSNCVFLPRFEFIFRINGSTDKKMDLWIPDLYKILVAVQKSLLEFAQESIHTYNSFQLEFEAEGNNSKEKDELYDYQLTRLSNKFTEGNVICTHCNMDGIHLLNFSKLDKPI